MSFSSGTFTLSQPDVVTGTTISSSWANSVLGDIATNGLTLCLLKNGTQTVTANIPFAGFRLTGIGAPTATNDALREGSAIGATTPAAGTFNSGSMTGLTALAIRDTSAAFDVTLAAVSSAALTAGRTLTLNMGNVAHTLAFGTTANTITFPNAASGTVPFLNLAQTFSAAQTFESASPQLTLGVLNTTAGGIRFFGSTSGNVTLAPAAAAGASVTVTLPAVTNTLAVLGANTFTGAQTIPGIVLTGNVTESGGARSITVTGAISGGAISGTTGAFTTSASIGASSSGNLLNLKGSVDSDLSGIQFTETTGGNVWWLTAGVAGVNSNRLAIKDVTAGAYRLVLDTGGIFTMGAYGAGTATFSAAGVISSVSDERLKIKDGNIKDPIPMLMALEPGYFFGKPEANMGGARQLGFYAQNVRKAIGSEAAPDPLEGKPWGYFDRSVLAVVVEAAKSHEARLLALEQQRR